MPPIFYELFRKMAVFWIVAPCSLVEVYQRFRGSTRRYNPEDSHLRTHRRENLKSYLWTIYFNDYSSDLPINGKYLG
jgi:hypothetical protein